MANPDGVVVGNTLSNMGGLLNEQHEVLNPELTHITQYLKQFQPGKLMMLIKLVDYYLKKFEQHQQLLSYSFE